MSRFARATLPRVGDYLESITALERREVSEIHGPDSNCPCCQSLQTRSSVSIACRVYPSVAIELSQDDACS
jgi:hypothetical protein